jgi:MoxR-like ATPase
MDVRDDESAGGGAGQAGGGAGQAAVIGSPAEIGKALEAEGYLADEQMEVACFLAVTMRRPLFLEGAAGVGKTAVADALARILKAPLIRLQCYEGIDAAQALYDWDFPRQLLHLRAAEASGTERDAGTLERELYSRDFLVARPLLRALETNPSVLLID